MLGQYWYHGLHRKYVTYFGSIFSDIVINRIDVNGVANQVMTVPIEYGPKERYLARELQNPDLFREVSYVLPRMGFEITNYSYDSSRKLNTLGQVGVTSSTSALSVYNPVPYNIEFTLSIISRNTDDAMRIVEQILPFFTPNWNQDLNLVTDLGNVYSVPLVLNSIKMTDTYANNFESKEFVIWDLIFTMKAWFFGPTTKANVIKEIIVNLHDVYDLNTAADGIGVTPSNIIIDIQPGLTANGEPTSNSYYSIPSANISANSNYGYIVNITEQLDTAVSNTAVKDGTLTFNFNTVKYSGLLSVINL